MKNVLFACIAALVLSGCAGFDLGGPPAAPYAPVNFQGDARLPATLRRVVVLPTHGGSAVDADSAAAMDEVVLAALQRQVRFEVVTISREESRRVFGSETFGSADALPAGFLDKLAEKYAADAVLFTDLTVYHTYRPLSIGFRSKLAAAGPEVRLIWAFDEVFSAEQETVRAAVRDYYRSTDRSAPVDPLPAALQSPSRFGAVAADLMFRTLPPR